MPTKNRGKAAHAIVGCAGDGGLGRVLHGDMAKANAPPLKASCLSARAQKNLLWGFAATAGMSMTRTKIEHRHSDQGGCQPCLDENGNS